MKQNTIPIIILLAVALLLASCDTPAPSTPGPSSTPVPTFTPFPTLTPTAVPTSIQPGLAEGAQCLPAIANVTYATVTHIDELGGFIAETDGSYKQYAFAGIQIAERIDVANMAASVINQHLVGAEATLIAEPMAPLDYLGRQPVYVIAQDVFLNYYLAKMGLASVVEGQNLACESVLLGAQEDAQLMFRGVWGP